ncbi:MAG: radical SAM protein [Desulfobacula sp.]|nr:radical SAM protein [Desulfobacula sp.]
MKILLTSVFGPYGVDDDFGRKENIMELFHNQITREQGLFSLRFNHQSFGLYFLAENIDVPTTVLDFPSKERFIKEIQKGYDYIGISFILPNFIKAKYMAEQIRKYAPKTKILLGGHGTSIPGIETLIENDSICRGEGVKWLRRMLGENTKKPINHPIMNSVFSKRILGMKLKTDAAVLIPGVGCTNGCRFCTTTHFFDKKYTPFFNTGKELFDVCRKVEKKLGHDEFFIMDENFLKVPQRAVELVELMEKHNKFYRFGIFSSAETIKQMGPEFLARLGVSFLWVGVESKQEVYEKNRDVDIKQMIKGLRDHGISVLASGILFSEHHDQQTIMDDIKFMVDLESDFVQFMGLGPLPGTKLYKDYDEKGILRKDIPYEEWHGQHQIWFKHPHFNLEESAGFLKNAFRYDYDKQGPSLLRMCDTVLRGYVTISNYKDPFMQKRALQLKKWVGHYRMMLQALHRFAHNDIVIDKTIKLIQEYDDQLGPMSLKQKIGTRFASYHAKREAIKILLSKNNYQPRTIMTKYRMSVKNLAVEALKGRSLSNMLNIHLNWDHEPIMVELAGTLDKINAKTFAKNLLGKLKREDCLVKLNLNQLIAIEDESLKRLLKRLRKYNQRVQIVFNDGVQVVDDAFASLPEKLKIMFIKEELVSSL